MSRQHGKALCECGEPVASRGLCVRDYYRMRAREIAYGRWVPDRVDAGPARERLAALRESGMAWRPLAEVVGVPAHTLRHVRERAVTVSRATEEAVLAVPVPERVADVLPDTARVPVLGARRRVQALIADGHTRASVAEALGMHPSNIANLVCEQPPRAERTGERVTAARDRQVKDLFDRWQLTPGTDPDARALGARNGWALPFEWDEEAIDDPAGTPTRSRATAATRQRDAVQAQRERVAELTHEGVSSRVIAERLEVSPRTVLRHRAAMSRPEFAGQVAPERDWGFER